MAETKRKFSQDPVVEASEDDAILGLTSRNVNVRYNIKSLFDKFSSSKANKKLKFTGASTATYDGSEEVTVNIPSGGGTSEIDGYADVTPNMTTDQIQNIIDMLSENGGGTVRFSKGKFVLTKPLKLRQCINLVGCGEKNTVITCQTDAPFPTVSVWIDASGSSTPTYANVSTLIDVENTANYCTIENMTLDGKRWTRDHWGTKPEALGVTDHVGSVFGVTCSGHTVTSDADNDTFGHLTDPDFVYTKNNPANNLKIRNVTVYGCDFGIGIGYMKFQYILENIRIVACGACGLLLAQSTDGMLNNIVVEQCGYNGAVIQSGNMKWSLGKIMWNGAFCESRAMSDLMSIDWGGLFFPYGTFGAGGTYALIYNVPQGQISCVEMQDNYCADCRLSGTNLDARLTIDGSQTRETKYLGTFPAVSCNNVTESHLDIRISNAQRTKNDAISTFSDGIYFEADAEGKNNVITITVGYNKLGTCALSGQLLAGRKGTGTLITPSGCQTYGGIINE